MFILETLAEYIRGMTGLIALETYSKLDLVPKSMRDAVYKIVMDWRRLGLGLDADRMLYFRLKYRSYQPELLVYAIIVILSAMKERDILNRIIKKYYGVRAWPRIRQGIVQLKHI